MTGPTGATGATGPGFTTISNTSDNRVLTSLGTTNTANAESNLTFDGSILAVTGNVGIGATAPDADLVVRDRTSYITLCNTYDLVSLKTNFKDRAENESSKYVLRSGIYAEPASGHDYPQLQFVSFVRSPLNTSNVVMTLQQSNVGIGTTTPSNPLDVNGTTRTSNLIAGGYLRNALVATQFDISGGNISNSATTRSSNFITPTATSNNIGGVTLSNGLITPTQINVVFSGSATSAGLYFNNTTNLGFYGVNANEVAFISSNAERLRFNQFGLFNGATASNTLGGVVLFNNAVSNVSTSSNSIGGNTLSNSRLGVGTNPTSFNLDVTGTARITGNTIAPAMYSLQVNTGSIANGASAVVTAWSNIMPARASNYSCLVAVVANIRATGTGNVGGALYAIGQFNTGTYTVLQMSLVGGGLGITFTTTTSNISLSNTVSSTQAFDVTFTVLGSNRAS
jgi:hypothetical protein